MECPNCSHERRAPLWRCPQCASVFDCRAVEEYSALGYVRSKLRLWQESRALGAITARAVSQLATQERERLAQELGLRPPEVAVPEAPAMPAAKPRRAEAPALPRERARPSVPGWLTEQAPNLLLYLGAFLVVMAALVFVAASGETISGVARVAMLASFTAALMAVGWLCYRFPRVRTAGYTFLVVGSLLLPLNFAAAHNFVLSDEGIPGDVVWLWASLYSLLFYLLLAILGLGVLFGFMSHAALVSGVAAALVLTGLPVEWVPPVFIGLSIAILPTAWWMPARLRETFRLPGLLTIHFLVVASIASSFLIVPAVERADTAAIPTTLTAGAILFAVLASANALNRGTAYGFLTHAGLTSALVTGLVVVSMPMQWSPAVFAGLAIAFLPFARWALARRLRTFRLPSLLFAHLLVVVSVVSACAISASHAEAHRAALPVTLGLATILFGLLAASEKEGRLAAFAYAPAALLTAGGALLGIVFVLDKQVEFYSVVLIGIAGLYALAAELPVKVRRLRAEVLWPFALGSATIAWLFFLDVHDREPWFGLGVTWGASALYLAAAVLDPRVAWLRTAYRMLSAGSRDESEQDAAIENWAGPALVLLFATTAGLGYFRLLTATVGDLAAEELALRYLPFALGFVAAGMAVRLWRRHLALALYAAALGFSIYVLGASYGDLAQTAVFMMVFAYAAAVVALWEREPNLSYLAVAYGLFALIFGLAHFQPLDDVWPLPFAGLGALLYGAGLLLRRTARAWAEPLRMSGLAVALFAPNVGFGLLSFRISEAMDAGETLSVVEPPLYLWSMGAVAFFGLLLAAEAGRIRSLLLGYASTIVLFTALLLGIADFRPDNPQAYVVPTGIYLLGTARLLSIRRELLPDDLRRAADLTEIAAAVVLLGTTLIQTFGENSTAYRFVLLGESITYLLVGLLLRRRLMVAPALAFAALSGALFAFEVQAEGGPPPWAILAAVGVALLGLGFLLVVRRDFWRRAQEFAINWWRAWET